MFRHVTLLRQQRIALGLTSAALARGSFQPFSQNDENDLVKVVTTKPRHVLKYVRQQVWRSRKRELQFRNTVTHLMIIVQEMLRKQLMEPACATEIMDGILEECVKYSQHDMAHLLFRAALRFRKYNCTISVDSIRYLFESYKTNQSTELMLQLATEMKSDPSLRPLCVAAYLFANHEKEAMELQAGLSYRDYTKNDFLALIVGYEKLGKPEAIVSILEGLKDRALGSNDETAVVEAMLRVFYRSQNDALFNQVLQYAVERQLTLNHTVCTTVLRHRTRQANSTAEVHAIEEEMKEMGYVPDATGNSVIISAFARLIHYGDRGSEELMLTKVDTLLASVEKRLEQGDPDLDVSVAHVRAIIRGYGAAGRPESLKDAWGRLRKSPITQDIRIYNELFRWLATMGNVKDVLTLKEELDKGTINPDALTYTWMLRALGRYYPRHVDQLCCEIEKHHIRPDVQLYNTMLGIFGDLGWFDKVEVTRADMKRRVDAGTLQLTPFTFAVLLRIYSKDGEKVQLIMNEAKERNVASHPHVQTSYLSAVMAQDSSDAVFDAYLKEIPVWGTDIYNVLLHKYGREKNLELFESTLAKMRKEEITMNDVTFGTLITAYARFGEREKVNGIIEIIKSDEGSVSPVFYSVLASSLNRLGNSDGVNTAWEDLVSSKLFPDTDVYNHFLGLYSRQHNVPKMQDVLDNMMRLVPPNPITATTVLDVLGKSGRVSEMEALFEDMKTSADTYPTSVTYHQMLNAYAKSGDTSKMEFLYQEMIEKGHRATAVTYNILLDGYGRVKNIERVEELLRERQSNGIPSDDISRSIQFSAYGRARRSDEVQKLLVDITEGETSNATLSKKVVWSAIDAGCRCRNAELMERAVELLKRFSEDGALSASDESSLIPYYCRLGQMEKVETLMEHAKQRGDALSYRALNAIARGYATMGRLDKTVEVLHQLRDSKWVPDASTALQLSGAFLQAGLHEQAKQIIDWRRQYANAVGSHSTSRST